MLSDRFCSFDDCAILSALFLPLSGQIRHRNKPKGRRSKILAFLSSISSAKYSFKLPVSRDMRKSILENENHPFIRNMLILLA
jgi:hypothetical protein